MKSAFTHWANLEAVRDELMKKSAMLIQANTYFSSLKNIAKGAKGNRPPL